MSQMRTLHAIFLLSLFISSILCSSAQNDKKFQVSGDGHCTDCLDNNFKPNQAFSGLHVSIDCKLQNGDMKRFAVAPLSDDGQFHVSIPGEIVHDGGKSLKHDCYAQLHSAAAVPCPTVDPLGAKIAFKSAKEGNYVFAPVKKLGFTAALCTSKPLWPYFKYPPLPSTHPWLKNFGHPWTFPPIPPFYKHPFYKKPFYKHPFLKPPTPVSTPPVPVTNPPAPVYTPPPVVIKPPKKPCPPTKPKPKPKPPVIVKPPKKPCPPKAKPPVIVKPPIVVKPLPPPVPIVKPPFYKKPYPPLPFPKSPPKSYFKHPLLPPLPKFPPKSYIKHPKLGNLPNIPPLPPHLP